VIRICSSWRALAHSALRLVIHPTRDDTVAPDHVTGASA